MKEQQLLVVAGFAKCGTTSLFTYLSQHPEICASTVKETNFFWPTREIQREPRHAAPPLRFEDGWDAYRTYFPDPEQPVWLEASNYARFAESAGNLHALCPQVKLVFLVRHPLERTLSAFRFRKLIGGLPHDLSFEDYVERESGTSPELYFGVGDVFMCRYSRFLQPFFDTFPASQLEVVGFRDLVTKTPVVVTEICRWTGIDEGPVREIDFSPENVTYHPRNWRLHAVYNALRMRVWDLRRRFPRAVDRVVAIHQQTLGPLYQRLNAQDRSEITMTPAISEMFDEIYADESAALQRLTGQRELLEPLSEQGPR